MLIVITGPSASGKSAFAARLAHELGIPFFTKDTLKIALSEHVAFEDPNETRHVLSRATSGVMFSVAESMLAAGAPCILEANFRQFECDHINGIISRYKCRCLTYLFAGDLHALARRFIERETTSERHENLRLPDFKPDQEYISRSFEQFVNVAIDSNTIRVDATSFKNIDFESLIDKARNFMQIVERP
ncbi:MAG: ATP-binding protein [Defluviitaleaceae bacterium]|nr:ATP-binding protein [Defluviitaleaceae bacterium]